MSWVPLAGGNQEKIPNERKVRGPSHAALTTSFLVAVTKARGYSIIPTWHDAAWGNLVPGKEVAETLFRLLEPFSKRVVDDDAALTRKFPSADHEAGRNPHAKTSPPSVVTDAGDIFS